MSKSTSYLLEQYFLISFVQLVKFSCRYVCNTLCITVYITFLHFNRVPIIISALIRLVCVVLILQHLVQQKIVHCNELDELLCQVIYIIVVIKQ